jgi:hypothetical protein
MLSAAKDLAGPWASGAKCGRLSSPILLSSDDAHANDRVVEDPRTS